jgi:hypothetical protein
VGAIPARYPPPGKFLHNSPVFAVGSLSSREMAHETRQPNITNSCPAPPAMELLKSEGGYWGGPAFRATYEGGYPPVVGPTTTQPFWQFMTCVSQLTR